MEYRRLGRSDIEVSIVCLGSMTWGEQNSEAEAHEQLDYALQAGINFIDTAELYPVPPRAETQGRTEEILGSWLQHRRDRERLIIASKVCAASDWVTYLRNGKVRLDRANIEAALDASLRRLRTDYLDLYQVHWPERDANFFGKLGYVHAPEKDGVPIEETLGVLGDLVLAGKVKHIGVCNETPWGVSSWLCVAESRGLPRIVSVQNPYNLLNRTFEIGLAEFAQREHTGLLAYSPLGFGVLSGKYVGGASPDQARLTLFKRFQRYINEQGVSATERYVALARDQGLEPAQMALAFVHSRPFLTSTIIGATTMEQLRSNVASASLTLPPDLLQAIEKIHTELPNPCP